MTILSILTTLMVSGHAAPPAASADRALSAVWPDATPAQRNTLRARVTSDVPAATDPDEAIAWARALGRGLREAHALSHGPAPREALPALLRDLTAGLGLVDLPVPRRSAVIYSATGLSLASLAFSVAVAAYTLRTGQSLNLYTNDLHEAVANIRQLEFNVMLSEISVGAAVLNILNFVGSMIRRERWPVVLPGARAVALHHARRSRRARFYRAVAEGWAEGGPAPVIRDENDLRRVFETIWPRARLNDACARLLTDDVGAKSAS